MFDIGFWELFLIGVVALLVVGPERLPRLVRITGLWIGRANASIRTIKNDISQELRAEELRESINRTVLENERSMNELKEAVDLSSVSEASSSENSIQNKQDNG